MLVCILTRAGMCIGLDFFINDYILYQYKGKRMEKVRREVNKLTKWILKPLFLFYEFSRKSDWNSNKLC